MCSGRGVELGDDSGLPRVKRSVSSSALLSSLWSGGLAALSEAPRSGTRAARAAAAPPRTPRTSALPVRRLPPIADPEGHLQTFWPGAETVVTVQPGNHRPGAVHGCHSRSRTSGSGTVHRPACRWRSRRTRSSSAHATQPGALPTVGAQGRASYRLVGRGHLPIEARAFGRESRQVSCITGIACVHRVGHIPVRLVTAPPRAQTKQPPDAQNRWRVGTPTRPRRGRPDPRGEPRG